MQIKNLGAKVIKDSRGEDTIEVSVNGCTASSPSGKSKGKYETPSWLGSVNWNVNEINSLKIDFELNEFSDLIKVEDVIRRKFKLKNVKEFGANALFALESAILKAIAKSKNIELWELINPRAKVFPTPLGNVIGGGLHSEQFDKHPTFQEFLLAPKGITFQEKVNIMKLIYSELQKIIKTKQINDEGALAAPLNEEEILSLLSKFLENTNFGIDVAASSFYEDTETYRYENKSLDKNAQISYINYLIDNFSPLYIEDPLNEEDFSGFSKIKKKHLICGDDLTVTNIKRLEKAIKMNSINAMIIKPNQNGSLLEVAKIFEICKKNRIKTILSHRSGETLDDALADYAFAFQADFIKCGIATKYREVKLNRLIEIEKSL